MTKLAAVIAALFVLALAGATPAPAAEALIMSCHTCDAVTTVGRGLAAHSTYQLQLRDVASGQAVTGRMPITADGSGAFVRKTMIDLHAHPTVEGALYASNGSLVVLAAHTRFQAPPMCAMAGMGMPESLPFTGADHVGGLVAWGAGTIAAGVLLTLAAGRRRRRA